MSRHTIRAAVEEVAGAKLKEATIAILIGILEEAKIADLAIVEEVGTVVAVGDGILLIGWPAGAMLPEIGAVTAGEFADNARTLITQQHDAIKQLAHVVRSLTRIVEVYTEATVYSHGAEGGEDGQ